jgi:hypothetical protein
MSTFSNYFQPKSSHNYICVKCRFYSSKKSNYDQHLMTRKHILATGKLEINQIQPNPATFLCPLCSKTYKDKSGLWRHKKKCIAADHNDCEPIIYDNDKTLKESIISDKELIMMLVKQNSQLMEVIKNGNCNPVNNTNNSHNNTSHSHNKTFNLQFFLNETCKDAMNIGEFVDSIKPQLADLEATGRLGYVEGISNIILNGLKTLNTQERPIHCSDQKREIIYIKNNNEWTKEEEDKPILTKAIKVIANENIKNISEWRKEHPDCINFESKKNDLYLKIVSNSMSGGTKEESDKNINKIISNVSKQVVINKSDKIF